MRTGISRKKEIGAALMFVALLGGCLTKVDSGVENTAANPRAQNIAPSISGSPQNAIMMGDTYTFTPSASDSDGDALAFSVQNLPVWASFDSVTGEISGQPLLADVGVFENLIISVTDGTATANLPSFSITVSQVALGSATLSWTPPIENMDGSALTDLAGYRIYYGSIDGDYPNRIDLNTAGLASYVVENLMPDEYEFVITAVNSSGIESPLSNVAFKYLP